MNIVKKVILSIKSMFTKQEKVEELAEPSVLVNENKNEKFIESLKTATVEKRPKKKIETLICEGDGLGIQKKMSS